MQKIASDDDTVKNMERGLLKAEPNNIIIQVLIYHGHEIFWIQD